MDKKSIFAGVYIFLLLLLTGCTNRSSNSNTSEREDGKSSISDTLNGGSSTQAEKEEEDSSEQNKENESNKAENLPRKIIDRYKDDDSDIVWTKEEHRAAEDFANKVVSYINSKDMEALSNVIDYPPLSITGANGEDLNINTKEEFIAKKFEDIFSDELVKNVNECTELFSNGQGFMIAAGPNIWFQPYENGEMKIYTINGK